jgi:hypothetical protein
MSRPGRRSALRGCAKLKSVPGLECDISIRRYALSTNREISLTSPNRNGLFSNLSMDVRSHTVANHPRISRRSSQTEPDNGIPVYFTGMALFQTKKSPSLTVDEESLRHGKIRPRHGSRKAIRIPLGGARQRHGGVRRGCALRFRLCASCPRTYCSASALARQVQVHVGYDE